MHPGHLADLLPDCLLQAALHVGPGVLQRQWRTQHRDVSAEQFQDVLLVLLDQIFVDGRVTGVALPHQSSVEIVSAVVEVRHSCPVLVVNRLALVRAVAAV